MEKEGEIRWKRSVILERISEKDRDRGARERLVRCKSGFLDV